MSDPVILGALVLVVELAVIEQWRASLDRRRFVSARELRRYGAAETLAALSFVVWVALICWRLLHPLTVVIVKPIEFVIGV